MTKKLTRRRVFGAICVSAGTYIGSGLLNVTQSGYAEDLKKAGYPWAYEKLDAGATSERAYESFTKGHCMYGVFESIIGQLGEKLGEPYKSFPVDMMDYGMGGVMGWGTLCGALNGAAAVISLFVGDLRQRGMLTNDLFGWYEQTALPIYIPQKTNAAVEVPRSAAGSELCHISVARWCEKAGLNFDSPVRAERCKRLAADTAGKTVEILNSWSEGKFKAVFEPNRKKRECLHCHGPERDTKSSFGRMSCNNCHSQKIGPNGTHPKEPNNAGKGIDLREPASDSNVKE